MHVAEHLMVSCLIAVALCAGQPEDVCYLGYIWPALSHGKAGSPAAAVQARVMITLSM
jgi:hypothetical protein